MARVETAAAEEEKQRGEIFTTTNSFMIRFQIGNFVVIGSDIDIYDIAKVDSVNEASKDLYYQADLRKQELKVLRKYRQNTGSHGDTHAPSTQ